MRPMRPPECDVCGKEEDCELVSFAMRQSDHEWRERMTRIHGTGHPPWQEWYCAEHAAIARRFSDLPRDEAGRKIREALKA